MTNNTIKTMNLPVADRVYQNVSIEDARVIETLLSKYQYTKVTATPTTTTSTPKAKTKAEPKAKPNYNKAYTVAEDGKSVTIGNGGFVPKSVFNAIKYSLKQSGATWDSYTKSWVFSTKKACKEWCKAQDARG